MSTSASTPTEFRVFARGKNTTTKGTFNFDAQAAEQVMSAYRRGGVDLPIDLDHLSLTADTSPRTDAADARGWFKLAVRNGELWATDVRWTPDGEARLSNRTQRYISPAFLRDENGRPTQLLNCALVAMPATHGAPALVAASRTCIVSARVTPAALANLRRVAASRRTTVSGILTTCLSALEQNDTTRPSQAVIDALTDLVAALGLPEQATAPTIVQAIQAALEAIAPPEAPADITAETVDVPAQLAQRTARRAARASSDPLAAPRATRLAAHKQTRRP